MKYKKLSIVVAAYLFQLELDDLAQVTRYKIADTIKVNKNYLSVRFKRETGVTLLQFITSERLKRAEFLLRTRHDLPARSISHMVGYEKYSQFTQKFRKTYLLNPGQYRRTVFKCFPCVNSRNPHQCLQVL